MQSEPTRRRPGNPNMRPGAPSVNPSGRSPGFRGVARQIMSATSDGAELVQWALDVWRDVARPHAERERAHQWLSERGLGRPLQSVDLHASISPGNDDRLDLAGLDPDER